jgi:hypothetical protein
MKQLAIVNQQARLIAWIMHVVIAVRLIYFIAVPISAFLILCVVSHEFFFISIEC